MIESLVCWEQGKATLCQDPKVLHRDWHLQARHSLGFVPTVCTESWNLYLWISVLLKLWWTGFLFLDCTRRWSFFVPLSSLMHSVFSHILLVFITWLWFEHWLLTVIPLTFSCLSERQHGFSADLSLPDSPRSSADRVGHSCDLKCSLLSFSLSS